MSLLNISQQIVVYSGIVFLLTGLFGNGMNMYIFSSVATYRQTPATFYFLIESICKSIFLIVNLLPRIIGFSYALDFANLSFVWCKVRQGLLMMSSTTAITCTCLSAIDQFLVTSANASLRRMSNIKWSHRIIMIVVIIWNLHSIPFYLHYNISTITKTCISTNSTLTAYIPVYFLLIVCCIPILIMIIFGSLTYRNIGQTIALAEQQADRQLLKMTFIQVILVLFCYTPLCGLQLYNAITSGLVKDKDQSLKEYFIFTIISTQTAFYYTTSFYIFFVSSSRFRRTIKGRLYRWGNANKIAPTQQT